MEPEEGNQNSEVISFQRERYHAIQSFDLTIWIILIYIWFLDNSTWALFARIIMQTAFCNQSNGISQPSSISLASSLFGVIFTNLILLVSHSTTNVRDLLDSKSIFIDFVSKESPPSNIHLVAMDLLLMTIQSLLVLLVDGTNRAELQKDDWRGDIDGLQQDLLEEVSNRNRTEHDLESGLVEEVSDSDDEEDSRNLIFDAEELDEERTETHKQKKKDEDADEIGFLGDEGTQESTPFLDSPSNPSSDTLRNRKRTRRNRGERSAYSEPIAVLSFSRSLSIFKSVMKNQMPEEEETPDVTARESNTDGRNAGESTASDASFSSSRGTLEPSRLNPEMRSDIDLQSENRVRIERELRSWSLSQRSRD